MKTKSKSSPERTGFALVATVLLMVLLAILCLGMLSLSAVNLRTASRSDASAEARANAKMAMMMAIERLQSELGPDQRVSANGSILSTDPVGHPHWTGVWNSWKAGGSSNGSVDGDSAHSTISGVSDTGMKPTYDTNRADHFRSWLVSLPQTDQADILSPKDFVITDPSEYPAKTSDAVRLVGEGSLGSAAAADDYVSAPLVDLRSESDQLTGRYGWWVGDQNQKAMITDDSYAAQTGLTAADKIFRNQAPASTGTQVVEGLEGISDDTQLAALPSLASLDLVKDVTGRPAQTNFHHISTSSRGVLADVREGGLKRDLNTILEQPINRGNSGNEYMLYAFDDPRFPYLNNPNDERWANSRVPIQDLSVYYQLYDDEPSFGNERREGVRYNSAGLADTIQLKVPDYDGGTKDRQRFIEEYTTLYKQPVIAKIQFLVGMTAQPITEQDRQEVQYRVDNPTAGSQIVPMRESDTHKLRLGIMPMVTLWNPNNLPLVMENSQILRYSTPPFGFRWRKYREGGEVVDLNWLNLNYAASPSGAGATTGSNSGFTLLRLNFAKDASRRVVFEPGEVKVFSLPASMGATLNNDGNKVHLVSEGTNQDVVNDWDPFGVFLVQNSSPQGAYFNEAPDAYRLGSDNQSGECLVFNPNDRITLSIDTDSPEATLSNSWRDGRMISASNEIQGVGFNLYMLDHGYQERWQDAIDFLRHYQMSSRNGSGSHQIRSEVAAFNKELITPGFPGGNVPIDFDSSLNAIPGSQIIAAADADEVIGVLEFSLTQGCEVGPGSSGGFGGGRRIASRPFLHSSSSAAPFIDQSDKASLYNYGWNWQVGEINTIEDSIVTAKPDSGNGYFGGGYTIENGTTHVVQREIPVLPPISIASLSHAQLGGFSLAYANPMGDDPDNDKYWFKSARMKTPQGVDYQRTTATGQAGLAPHVMQAIGNSYAHPNVPANKAFTTWTRLFDADEGPHDVPFADHSYLANKALWDEFFFSSIAPQPSKVELFGGTPRTAKEVAEDFFFDDKPLPNRRIVPYSEGLDEAGLTDLFDQADDFSDGLADRIASHLMVEGAFNVNSTSVEAWKTLLSSMRGKPSAYFESGKVPSEANPAGTLANQAGLPNSTPITSDQILSPNTPEEQWKGSRELTDAEIDALAKAIVHQVKLRGPFLSLSEFVNRRLEGDSNPDASERSLKGALQAALDDPGDPADPVNRPEVTINAGFRENNRLLDDEVTGINFAFKDAAKGPIAYGSAAYVDQADVLRGLAAQLMPRGDTFVIRAYGDSIDAAGEVAARAWCEALVQRVPSYVDPAADEPQVKQADLNSPSNKEFGRRFDIIGFRWLNPDEV